jgi:hypothetical protein
VNDPLDLLVTGSTAAPGVAGRTHLSQAAGPVDDGEANDTIRDGTAQADDHRVCY